MNESTDIIKIETNITLLDKKGNIIIIQTPQPEKIELWV